jgi:hypothetical protein
MALMCFGQISEVPKVLRTVSPEGKRDVNLERAIRRELGEERFSYAYNRVSLSGGARLDVLVYISGPDYCGSGGCTLLAFALRNGDYRVVSRLTLIRAPVIVSSHRTNGWKDLIVFVSGGGIQPGYYAVLAFDGKGYPENPTVAPAAPLREKVAGTAYLAGADNAKFDIVSVSPDGDYACFYRK